MLSGNYNILPQKEFPPHILRMAKNAAKKSKINLRVKSQRNQTAGELPILRAKPKGGAPRGNRNALKTGFHTAEARALRNRIGQHIAKVKLDIANFRLAVALKMLEAS